MTTTELPQSFRSMSPQDQVLAMAITVLVERVQRLPEKDRDDLFKMVLEGVASAKTQDDLLGIRDTMLEVFDGCAADVDEIDLAEAKRPEKLGRWTDFVSKKVKEAREEMGLTQTQLAEKSGLPQSHISRIENAKLSPSRLTIERIASALGKEVVFFDPC